MQKVKPDRLRKWQKTLHTTTTITPYEHDNDNNHASRSLVKIHQKEEKVVTTQVAKPVFNVGEITHLLEIAQQKEINAINAKKKVILKDTSD